MLTYQFRAHYAIAAARVGDLAKVDDLLAKLRPFAEFNPDNLEQTGLFYCAFVLVDLIAGVVAFSFEQPSGKPPLVSPTPAANSWHAAAAAAVHWIEVCRRLFFFTPTSAPHAPQATGERPTST